MSDAHTPVLFNEVLDLLHPRPGGRYVDGTVGAGGHAAGILARSAPDGRLLAFDRDPEALAFAAARLAPFGDRVTCVHASYARMGELAPRYGFTAVDGVLLDLGLSSRQLDNAGRGFAFRHDGPLDMRFDQTRGRTAADLVNTLDEAALADIFWRYGEERANRRIARAIVAARPIQSTAELAAVVADARGRGRGRPGRHPATQVFQALRIAVNDELDAVAEGLDAAIALLAPGGRLAVISFHSLEDRLVKHTFRDWRPHCVCPPAQPVCTCGEPGVARAVTRKAVKPGPAEIERNPRSRSSRLRVVEKVEARP